MASPTVTEPIRTEPNPTHYEWAGSGLQRLFASELPIAETWAFFSGPGRAARIASPPELRGRTMEQLAAEHPEILGSAGADPEQGGQKYFFVKFLDPSDFPPFAYVGFDPAPVAAVRQELERSRGRAFSDEAEWLAAFRAHVGGLLWHDRQQVEAFAGLVKGRVNSPRLFAALKAAYKHWAIAQAAANWTSAELPKLDDLVQRADLPAARSCLTAQLATRQALTRLMHRIDFEDDQAILIETPTLHAIAGLSLQIHPKVAGNFFPKDELWIYKRLELPGGQHGWTLVEPQRTFDKTESGADFFTPFAWEGIGGEGRLGFRKPITQGYLQTFVTLMDAAALPRAHYLRAAQPAEWPGTTASGGARWYRVVEEPAWPYFIVRELRFSAPGAGTMTLSRACFTELHVTQGAVDVELSGGGAAPQTCRVTPSQPALLPASLPHGTVTYRAAEPSCLHLFTRQ